MTANDRLGFSALGSSGGGVSVDSEWTGWASVTSGNGCGEHLVPEKDRLGFSISTSAERGTMELPSLLCCT